MDYVGIRVPTRYIIVYFQLSNALRNTRSTLSRPGRAANYVSSYAHFSTHLTKSGVSLGTLCQ
jgi:hypothetical protein